MTEKDVVSHSTQAGFWERLRRRKVVQWGIAYLAAGWGLLQGYAYASATFGWPGHLQRFALLTFIVGFPVALVLAWYHGDKGHQRVSGGEFAILTFLLLVGGGMFWWVGRMPATPVVAGGPAPAAAAPAVAAAGPSIAVLPFVNMSGDKENEYFADGISEELLNVLAKVDGLGVASRTSSFGYKGSPLGTAEIARELGVNHVLEGSVRKSGNHVRITAQLIDATNDRHLWSETYDRELTDIFAIQEEIANAIVGALRDKLGSQQAVQQVTVRADTDNLEAYQLYLKARELFIARRDLGESARLFQRVTEMDPNFARGWEGLAGVYVIMESWGLRDRDYTPLAIQAADRALELDPSLSMPWAVLAMAARATWPVDWSRAMDLSNRAIEADPKNATAWLWRAISWLYLGFFERAIADFDRALELEPGYPIAVRHKAVTLVYAGRFDDGLEWFGRGVEAGFVPTLAENFIGPLVARGDVLTARLLLKDMGYPPEVARAFVDALRRPGATHPAAGRLIEQFQSRTDLPIIIAVGMTHPYIWLGDFERAGQSDDSVTTALTTWERYPPGWRNSAGFKHKLAASGVLAYWRKEGFPPRCRPVGQDDFTCD